VYSNSRNLFLIYNNGTFTANYFHFKAENFSMYDERLYRRVPIAVDQGLWKVG